MKRLRRVLVILVWAIIEYALAVSVFSSLPGSALAIALNGIVFAMGAVGLWVVTGRESRGSKEAKGREQAWKHINEEDPLTPVEAAQVKTDKDNDDDVIPFVLEDKLVDSGRVRLVFDAEADFDVKKIFKNVEIKGMRVVEKVEPKVPEKPPTEEASKGGV